jgi:hypothetical protein
MNTQASTLNLRSFSEEGQIFMLSLSKHQPATFEASAKKVNLQSLRKNTYLYLPISFYF